MVKIAVYGQNYVKETTQKAVEKLLDFLLHKEVDVFFESAFLSIQPDSIKNNSAINKFTNLDKTFDLLISIGGDGTILRAITFIRIRHITGGWVHSDE